MKLRYGIIWQQWLFGFWWWRGGRDLAWGVQFGPLYVNYAKGGQ